MEVLALFFIVLPVLLLVALVRGWIAFRKTVELEAELKRLQQQVWALQADRLYQKPGAPPIPQAPPPSDRVEPQPAAAKTAAAIEPRRQAETVDNAAPANDFWRRLRETWMIWLGGGSIGLAGIFMVRYGIEQGLLGPGARVALALLTGVGLHLLAEFLRRRSDSPQPALAALAGGASITLFAALLAALHLYQLLSPGLVFLLLALVSMLTMLLALRHGPVLAIIGLLGAYGVPMWVSTGSNDLTSALIYALIIAGAALVLMRYVYRPWLWVGMLAGALFWGFVSLPETTADGFRPLYCALLAYALLAIPAFDWRLRSPQDIDALSWTVLLAPAYRRESVSLLLVLVLSVSSLMAQPFSLGVLMIHLLPVAVFFLAARYRDPLVWLPWLALLVVAASQLPVVLESRRVLSDPVPVGQGEWLSAYALAASAFSALALWNLGLSRHKAIWASLAFFAPLVWLALAYLRLPELVAHGQWAAGTLLLGGVYVFIAGARLQRRAQDVAAIWLLLAGHGAYSLAVAMVFREAGLTLALALQLVSLAWLIRRFELRGLEWLLKLVIAVVVIRLTLNPWLLTYPAEVHWSLWTYGGATVCCAVAARLLADQVTLTRWLEAAALHLLVLTLGAETRYWLYDGEVFAGRYGFLEAAINTNLWAALALVYHYRARFSQHMRVIYRPAARILMGLALLSYALLLTKLNPFFVSQDVAATPVFNSLLLAYGLPVLLAGLAWRYYEPRFQRWAAGVLAVAVFAFINLEIRHLWNGAVDQYLPTSSGELYTYSLVWLLISVAAVLLGAARRLEPLYRAGMLLLLAVIAKIFMVDMSDLDGLLRVASFMGLGLTLLGLSFLHKRLNTGAREMR